MNGDKQYIIVDAIVNGKMKYGVQVMRNTDMGLVCINWCRWVDSREEAEAQIEMMKGAEETE